MSLNCPTIRIERGQVWIMGTFDAAGLAKLRKQLAIIDQLLGLDDAESDTNSAVPTKDDPRPMEGAAEHGGGKVDPAATNPDTVQPDPANGGKLASGVGEGDDGLTVETARGAGASPASHDATGKPGEDGNASSPAPSLRQRIIALHAEHPEYTAREALEALGCKTSSLTGYSSMLGLKWAPSPHSGGRPSKKPAQARSPDPAPEPVPEPEAPPAVTPEPANDIPRAPRPLSGSKFYLVNDAGLYLNRFCAGFTRDRREAWIGDGKQLLGCRRNFEIARDLRERPVAKELPPAPVNREVA